MIAPPDAVPSPVQDAGGRGAAARQIELDGLWWTELLPTPASFEPDWPPYPGPQNVAQRRMQHWREVDSEDRDRVPSQLPRDDEAWTTVVVRSAPDQGALSRSSGLSGDVTPLVTTRPDPIALRRAVDWFRIDVPPGATQLRLPAVGDLEVFLNGQELPVSAATVQLPDRSDTGSTLLVRVDAGQGRTASAIWAGPPTFSVGAGQMPVGAWAQFGLGGWSDGVAYRRSVTLDALGLGGAGVSRHVALDLGEVQGVAEVRLNGQVAGVRSRGPYVFEVGHLLDRPVNDVEVVVYARLESTIFASGSPASGLMGPVWLRLGPVREQSRGTSPDM